MPQKKHIIATEDRRKSGQSVPLGDTGDGVPRSSRMNRKSRIALATRTKRRRIPVIPPRSPMGLRRTRLAKWRAKVRLKRQAKSRLQIPMISNCRLPNAGDVLRQRDTVAILHQRQALEQFVFQVEVGESFRMAGLAVVSVSAGCSTTIAARRDGIAT